MYFWKGFVYLAELKFEWSRQRIYLDEGLCLHREHKSCPGG